MDGPSPEDLSHLEQLFPYGWGPKNPAGETENAPPPEVQPPKSPIEKVARPKVRFPLCLSHFSSCPCPTARAFCFPLEILTPCRPGGSWCLEVEELVCCPNSIQWSFLIICFKARPLSLQNLAIKN